MGGYALYPKPGHIDILHVFVLRVEVIALPVGVVTKPLQRVLVLVGEGNDDLSDLGGVLLPDDNKVAIVNLRPRHGAAGGAESVEVPLAEEGHGQRQVFLHLGFLFLRRAAGDGADNGGGANRRIHPSDLRRGERTVFVENHILLRHCHKVSVCGGNRDPHGSGDLPDGGGRGIPLEVAFDVLPDAEHKLLALASHIVLISYLEQKFLIALLYTKRAENQGRKRRCAIRCTPSGKNLHFLT